MFIYFPSKHSKVLTFYYKLTARNMQFGASSDAGMTGSLYKKPLKMALGGSFWVVKICFTFYFSVFSLKTVKKSFIWFVTC